MSMAATWPDTISDSRIGRPSPGSGLVYRALTASGRHLMIAVRETFANQPEKSAMTKYHLISSFT